MSVPDLVSRLWRGEVPLPVAFWKFAILYGLLANFFATIASLSTVSADAPAWLAVALFLLPAPYNLFMGVSVWRSADRYTGPRLWADLARPLIVLWVVAVSLV